jgi:hypothetical protein
VEKTISLQLLHWQTKSVPPSGSFHYLAVPVAMASPEHEVDPRRRGPVSFTRSASEVNWVQTERHLLTNFRLNAGRRSASGDVANLNVVSSLASSEIILLHTAI